MTDPSNFPSMPDFKAVERAAPKSAEGRTMVLALIGNMVFSWSNNESIFIYVLMLLMRTDERTATIVFATLNTTRARLDLVSRLALEKISDPALLHELHHLIEQFHRYTRARNELTHCMFSLNDSGEITHTQTMRVQETRAGLKLGSSRKMDDRRLREMTLVIKDLKKFNRSLWEFLPRLETSLAISKADLVRAARK